MGKFGLGNTSLKKKMASLKQDKESLAASKTAEAGDLVPDAPKVPDADELKDAAEDRAEEMVEEAKEASGTAAFNMKTTATAVEKQKWLSYNKSFTKVLTASPNSVDPHFFVS